MTNYRTLIELLPLCEPHQQVHGKQLRQNNFNFKAKKLQDSVFGKNPESYFSQFKSEEELLNYWLREAKIMAKKFVDDERKKGRAWLESGTRGRRGRAKKKDTASSSVHLEATNSGKRSASKTKPESSDKPSTDDDKRQPVDQQTIKQKAYHDYTANPVQSFTILSHSNPVQSYRTEQYDQVNDPIYEINLKETDLVNRNCHKLDDELLTSSIVDVPADHCSLNDATLNEITMNDINELIVLSAPNDHQQSNWHEAFQSCQRSEADIDLPCHLEVYDTTTLNCQFDLAASLNESSDLVGTNEFIPI